MEHTEITAAAPRPRGTRRARRAVAAVMVSAALVPLAACSSSTTSTDGPNGTSAGSVDDRSADASAGTALGSGTTVTGPGSTTETTSAPSTSSSTTGPDGPTTPSSASVSTTSPPTPGSEAFCNRLLEYQTEMDTFEPDTDDMAAAEEAYLTFLRRLFAEMAALAPPSIAADWAVLNDAVQSATAMIDLENATANPDFEATTERVDDWVTANCGFDMS